MFFLTQRFQKLIYADKLTSEISVHKALHRALYHWFLENKVDLVVECSIQHDSLTYMEISDQVTRPLVGRSEGLGFAFLCSHNVEV